MTVLYASSFKFSTLLQLKGLRLLYAQLMEG